jgi:hypothetical protein
MRKALFVAALCMILCLSGCQQVNFDGSRTSNEDQYIIEYRVLNKTDSAELQLSAGDVVDVEIVANSGKVDVLVKHSDGTEIYRGNDATTGSFKLDIAKAGTYQFSVSGDNANGSVRFIKEK